MNIAVERNDWVPHDELQRRIHRANSWLCRSGVIDAQGAATAWLAPEDPAQQFISSEITGYATSYFCWRKNIAAARHSAHWLITTALDEQNGSIRCRFYTGEASSVYTTSAHQRAPFQHDGPMRWTFDAGIVLQGLIDLYCATRSAELEQPIHLIVDYLLSICQPNGIFAARWDVNRMQPAHDPARWSAQPGPYHIKVERTLFLASQLLERAQWTVDLVDRVDQYIEQFQTCDGAFLAYPTSGGVHSHPHLYACEGLWVLGLLTQNSDWLMSAKRGLQWLVESRHNGRIPRTRFAPGATIEGVNYYGRCDVAAQYLRCLLMFDYAPEFVEEAYHSLCEYINDDGAFVFGWNADGTRNLHPDTWGTISAIQAFTWLSGSESPDPSNLI